MRGKSKLRPLVVAVLDGWRCKVLRGWKAVHTTAVYPSRDAAYAAGEAWQQDERHPPEADILPGLQL